MDDNKVVAFARRSDPATSWEATHEVTKHLRPLQLKVLRYAFQRGAKGFTDVELAEHFDCTGSTYRTRRAELTAKGYICDTGAKVGERGRRHIVWQVTAEGGHALIHGADNPPPLAA